MFRYLILQHLNPITMGRLGSTCKMMRKLTDDGISYLWERNEIVCFHSKRHFSQDTLGNYIFIFKYKLYVLLFSNRELMYLQELELIWRVK